MRKNVYVNRKINNFPFLLLFILPLFLFIESKGGELKSGPSDFIIKGHVSDTMRAPLPGVTVLIKGTSIATVTDLNGNYSIEVPNGDAVLVFSFIGYEQQEIFVNGRLQIDVLMKLSTATMDEVVVTAFGTKQKKESVVGAISTVNAKDLRVPSSNLTQAFAGKLPGVIAFQRSGEPGLDDAQFFIRGITSFSSAGKKDPLILVDGIEMNSSDLARINVDDIASFSVMKDANAAALYGARGANGVILITTKEGEVGKLKISIRGEYSNSFNSELVQLADPVTYMRLHNEAVITRDPMEIRPYSLSKIRNTQLGLDSILYPSVDWYDYMIANKAESERLNLNLTGGGQTVQYFLSANYQKDEGILKERKDNIFNNNLNIDKLQLRSNVTIKLAPTTTGVIRAFGSFNNSKGPIDGAAEAFNLARNATPVQFLPFYPPDSVNQYTKHILFGSGPELGTYINPVAREVSSFVQSRESMMLWQMEIEHDFSTGVLNGLNIKGTYNIMRRALHSHSRGYTPFYYYPATTIDDSYKLIALNPDEGTEYLTFSDGTRTISSTMYGEIRLGYNKTFEEKHDMNITLVGTIRSEHNAIGDLLTSLPHNNLSSAGRFAYGFKDKYFAEFNFGYNGTERFAKNNRFGFFPSIGVGWMLTNEEFIPKSDLLSQLKLRATYGIVGNDQIGSLSDRFFYLSKVDMEGPGYWFGLNREWRDGIGIDRYANDKITWEIAKKTDLGLDARFFDDQLEINADLYWETRSNILMTREDVPTTLGLRTIPQSNIGIASSQGFEVSLSHQQTFNKDFWLVINGNFTYASSKYKQYEEPNYTDAPWRSHIGLKLNQPIGYIAERLFIDQKEVNNSPDQELGEYSAGDLKYKDINGDGKINSDDMVPIGFPIIPEVIYGGGFSFGYKALDFSIFFQGSARSSFFISPSDITPFINQGQRALLQVIADNHWSENNRDLGAFWPRLSTRNIKNNSVSSTHWLRNGAFVRLKSAEVGYTLPLKLTQKISIKNLRVYLSGLNLFVWSKFDMWDPEMAGNGLGYPIQRVVNVGINIDL